MVMHEMERLRREYHEKLCCDILAAKGTTVNIADIDNESSKAISSELARLMGGARCASVPSNPGKLFSEITRDYIERSFHQLEKLRPGDWGFKVERPIGEFDQYRHLKELSELVKENREIAILLGEIYLVKPDIVVFRMPLPETELKAQGDTGTYDNIAKYTPIRKKNSTYPILHAIVSCKWTMRSDRSQNTRTEALNLIRSRRGNTPHITAVIAEPLPTRIQSIALGTGDIDCVYHIALPELRQAVAAIDNPDQLEVLDNLIDGRRLRDISDLIFDLAI